MPEPPIYADYTMSARTDDFFRWFAQVADPHWENGNVQAPTGWFALLKPDRSDIAEYATGFGDPYVSQGSVLPAYRWYLYQVNDDGLVWAHSYEGLDGLRPDEEQRRRALADFHRLTRLYTIWGIEVYQ